MEIQTTNLLGITLQQSRLQNNFIFIDAALKNINEQLLNLSLNHDSILKTNNKNKHEIQNILARLNQHQTQIHQHSEWIEQMNVQFEEESPPEQPSKKLFEHQMKSLKNVGSRKDIPEMKLQDEKNQSKKIEAKNQKVNEIKAQTIEKKESVPPSKAAKSSLQKTLSSLKERLASLQQQCEANRQPIDQLNKILARQKAREEQHLQKRTRQLANKRKSLKKDQVTEQNKPEGQNVQAEAKRKSERSMESNINDIFDIFGGKNLTGLDTDKYDMANKEMSKEVQSLKENIVDKIRSIEAQYRENQNRLMGIQKTVDVMERNYEMLKYDFDRTTSAGWSRQRTNDTQERGKRDNKLNETQGSSRQFYQEKMMEIFQEMDKLKKEYMQIQNKIEGEDVSEIGQLLQKTSDDSCSKISNLKLVSAIKNDAGQNKKEVATLKKELNRLRQEFEEFAWGVNTNPGETKTVVIKPNETKEDWKALSTKIYKLKMELQAGVRDLSSKIVTNNDMVVVLNQLQVGIEQCRLLIKRKVEQSDYETGLKRVETRLNNFIMQVYEKEGRQNENQAALAKQPWFCLSCDTQLKNFSGKIPKSPTNQKLQGKKVNPQSHMVRRYDNSRLPSVLK